MNAFSLEGFAFFTEAIFLGIYLYGWNKVPSWFHFLSGTIVALSGLLSAMFVTLVNGWMNTPTGFEIVGGKFTDIRQFAAMMNPAGIPEAVHMILAAYTGAGFATAGIHAWLLLRRGRNRFDEVAIGIALAVGGTAVLLQSVSGDSLARMVAATQPAKLAQKKGTIKDVQGVMRHSRTARPLMSTCRRFQLVSNRPSIPSTRSCESRMSRTGRDRGSRCQPEESGAVGASLREI